MAKTAPETCPRCNSAIKPAPVSYGTKPPAYRCLTCGYAPGRAVPVPATMGSREFLGRLFVDPASRAAEDRFAASDANTPHTVAGFDHLLADLGA